MISFSVFEVGVVGMYDIVDRAFSSSIEGHKEARNAFLSNGQNIQLYFKTKHTSHS